MAASPNQADVKPKLLITGGLGFIFSHVTEYFTALGWDVSVADNLSVGSHPEILNGTFKFYHLDASNPEIAVLITALQPDYIIHAAAISDVDFSIKNPVTTYINNVGSTLRIFEAARSLPNLKKLMYVSTDEVYGECEYPHAEDQIIFPKNPYSFSKAVGSIMRLAWDNTYPELYDKTCETRFCNVFGPRQDSRKIIPAIKNAIDTGVPVSIHNDGVAYRQWLYVKEIPSVVHMILEHGNRTYNVTSDIGHTVLDLVMKAEKIIGRDIPKQSGGRTGMDMRYEMDGNRLRTQFKWVPQYDFDKAFEAYILGKPL